MYRRLNPALRTIAVAVCAGVLSACGGSGAGVATSRPLTASMQAQSRTVSSASTQSAAGKVTLTIGIRSKPAAPSGGRRPAYVSPSTESMQILVNGIDPVVVNLTPGSPNCTTYLAPPGSYICTASLNAPDGSDVFTVTTYDQLNGQGSVLSTNTTGAVDVKPRGTNRISIVLNGVVQKAALALTIPNPPVGKAAVIGLSVVFADADDNLIVGTAPFDHAVTLTTSDSVNGAISKTALNSPADAAGISVSYSGAKVGKITFSASAPDLAATNVLPGVLTPGASTAPQHLYIVSAAYPNPGIQVYRVSDLAAAPTIIPAVSKTIQGSEFQGLSVAAGAGDRLYVLSYAGIYVFDVAHGNALLPTVEENPGESTSGIAVDSSAKLYVTSGSYDPPGGVIDVFGMGYDDLKLTPISGNGLNNPVADAVDASGKLYVLNAPSNGSRYINVFDTARGNAPLPSILLDALSLPVAVAVDAGGRLYVSNRSGSISVFDTLHGNAALPKISGGGLNNPTAVAVDAAGKLYVLNGGNFYHETVSVFDTLKDNKPLTVVNLPSGPNNYYDGIAIH